MGLLTNIFRPSVAKAAAEGQNKPGPWLVTEGEIPATWPWNFWQQGRNPIPRAEYSTMVEACISAYSQTVAMCPGSHWLTREDGGRDRVTNSDLNRILRVPNKYQSISDFLLNGVRGLYGEGNWYALAFRNDRNEVSELHLMDPSKCDVSAITTEGSLYYNLGGNPVVDQLDLDLRYVPARDVLHIRLHGSHRRPFKGESPLVVAATAAEVHGAMSASQLQFIKNQSRPSGVLSTDLNLPIEKARELRQAWDEQVKGLATGSVPILTNGLKFSAMSQTNQNSQLAEVMKMTREDIALAFRIPLQILGLGSAPFSSTEALMQSWVAQSLGFLLNHIEESIGNFFKLKGQPEEYLELDTEVLLRSSLKERMEAYSKGTQGGIYAINEARFKEGLPKKEGGDEPRVQQQLVPLTYGMQMQPNPPAAPALPAPADEEDDEPEGDEENERHSPEVIAGRLYELARI